MSDDNARARGFCSNLIIFEYSYVKRGSRSVAKSPPTSFPGSFLYFEKVSPHCLLGGVKA